MISKKTTSGSYSIPSILPYKSYLPEKFVKNLKGITCNIIRHYGAEGLSVLIYRRPSDDSVIVVCGDWAGNAIDLIIKSPLSIAANEFISEQLPIFIKTMNIIKLEQCQLFLTTDPLMLVDIQVAIDKLASPGMVRDLFGKIIATQEILKVEQLTDNSVAAILAGTGSYANDIIIKPSKFRLENFNNSYIPFYVEVRR